MGSFDSPFLLSDSQSVGAEKVTVLTSEGVTGSSAGRQFKVE